MSLSAGDFRAFWRQVHAPHLDPHESGGPAPFAWQQRLVDHVVAQGRWPDVLDVPTGLGKTTALDVAVFTLALSRTSPSMSPLPRRIFMVIDRRIVVDQSFDHAERIGETLRNADPGSIAGRIATALRPAALDRHDLLDGTDQDLPIPLVVGRMRGGTTWAWRWLERPDQPAIIVGTIDQLGSRMLFDGYGVGETLRSIDAALTGADSLVLVDEAHLADAFLTTLRDASRMGTGSEPLGLASPSIVVMSATARPPRRDADEPPPFRIDREQELADPVAAARLRAPKTLITVETKVSKARRVAETGAALANVARELGRRHDVVGVVANTVAVARAAFDALRAGATAAAGSDHIVLITGRQRAVDRDRLWNTWKARVSAGRARQDGPVYVVATQTIEVGADLDFSALVSESASIDALIQRLGRLNRRGDWEEGTAVVVHPSTVTADDPIYGAGRQITWEWLVGHVAPQEVGQRSATLEIEHGMDVGPIALDELLHAAGQDLAGRMRMPPPTVPVLFPSTLERWVRTCPRSLDSPPTGPYLHGLDRDLPSVTVLWRHARRLADVGMRGVHADLLASIDLLPPSPSETVEVPLWAAEAWLRDDASAADLPDLLEVAIQPNVGVEQVTDLPLVVLDAADAARPLQLPLRPGTTVVAPTWLGGLDEHGWNPASTAPVLDVADLGEHRLATSTGRRVRRLALRIDEATLRPFMPDGEVIEWLEGAVTAAGVALIEGDEPREVSMRFLAELSDRLANAEGGDADMKKLVEELLSAGKELRGVVPPPLEPARQPVLLVHGRGAIERWSTERTHVGTSLSGQQVPLEAHQAAVAARAEAFADALGLPDHLREAVAIAAAHHDVGKLDPRFQRMLNGGVAPPAVPLAKSGMDPASRWLFRRSQQLAGYPAGMRHEAFSARAAREIYAGHDECDLIVHLVAAHHGRGRPLEQCIADPEPLTYEIVTAAGAVTVSTADGPDWDQPRRFRQLNERFGPWGLAMLEAIVRLSDIGCSAEGT